MTTVQDLWPEWSAEEQLGQGAYGTVWRIVKDAGGVQMMRAAKLVEVPPTRSEAEALRRETGKDDERLRAYYEQSAREVMGEVATMEQLRGYPNVVNIEDCKLVPQVDGLGWTIGIRMELLEPLVDLVDDEGKPDASEIARMGADISWALDACHELGVVHRDVKPSNVFRSADGTYKLGDFGIARMLEEDVTTELSHRGTPSYMAPEIVHGTYDGRVDQYSLGIMMYRMLNGGRQPFLEVDPREASPADRRQAESKRLAGEPLPAIEGVDSQLMDIVLRMCSSDPELRYPADQDIYEDLCAWLVQQEASEEEAAKGEETPEDATASEEATEKEETPEEASDENEATSDDTEEKKPEAEAPADAAADEARQEAEPEVADEPEPEAKEQEAEVEDAEGEDAPKDEPESQEEPSAEAAEDSEQEESPDKPEADPAAIARTMRIDHRVPDMRDAAGTSRPSVQELIDERRKTAAKVAKRASKPGAQHKKGAATHGKQQPETNLTPAIAVAGVTAALGLGIFVLELTSPGMLDISTPEPIEAAQQEGAASTQTNSHAEVDPSWPHAEQIKLAINHMSDAYGVACGTTTDTAVVLDDGSVQVTLVPLDMDDKDARVTVLISYPEEIEEVEETDSDAVDEPQPTFADDWYYLSRNHEFDQQVNYELADVLSYLPEGSWAAEADLARDVVGWYTPDQSMWWDIIYLISESEVSPISTDVADLHASMSLNVYLAPAAAGQGERVANDVIAYLTQLTYRPSFAHGDVWVNVYELDGTPDGRTMTVEYGKRHAWSFAARDEKRDNNPDAWAFYARVRDDGTWNGHILSYDEKLDIHEDGSRHVYWKRSDN